MHALKKYIMAKLYDQLGGGLPGVGDTTMRNKYNFQMKLGSAITGLKHKEAVSLPECLS
jgi:hypothetical protein